MTVAAVPVPAPPRGSVGAEPLQGYDGEVGRWRHTHQLPALEIRFFEPRPEGGLPAAPARVRVDIYPKACEEHTDPRELRQMAWCLLSAAQWLDRQQPASAPVEEPEAPQLTIYDALGATP